jgi:predicted protein tyrosine phosphatase
MVNFLFICSANKERSPTAEQVFKDVPDWIDRSAGTERDATKKITSDLLEWANEIIVIARAYYIHNLVACKHNMHFLKRLLHSINHIYLLQHT